jgi:hypothetical protein
VSFDSQSTRRLFIGQKKREVLSGEITGFTPAGRLKPPNAQSGSLFSVWANACPVKIDVHIARPAIKFFIDFLSVIKSHFSNID